MRFELTAALVIEVLLPLLETCRRGISEWRRLHDDVHGLLSGALLLIAAWAAYRGRRWGALFLVVAWAFIQLNDGSRIWF